MTLYELLKFKVKSYLLMIFRYIILVYVLSVCQCFPVVNPICRCMFLYMRVRVRVDLCEFLCVRSI